MSTNIRHYVTKYNGNDLNWERLEGVERVCLDCLKARIEAGYELMTDEQQEHYDQKHEMDCDGHEFIYFEHQVSYPNGEYTTTAELFNDWYGFMVANPNESPDVELADFLDWYIIHDTNGNFVTICGEAPDDVIREESLKEKGAPTPKKKVNRDE